MILFSAFSAIASFAILLAFPTEDHISPKLPVDERTSTPVLHFQVVCRDAKHSKLACQPINNAGIFFNYTVKKGERVTPVGPLHVGKYGTLFPPPTEWDALNLEYVEKDHSLESTFSRYFIVDTKTGKTRYGYDRSLQEGEVVGPFEVSNGVVLFQGKSKWRACIHYFLNEKSQDYWTLEWGTVSDNYVPISLEAKPGLFHGS